VEAIKKHSTRGGKKKGLKGSQEKHLILADSSRNEEEVQKGGKKEGGKMEEGDLLED